MLSIWALRLDASCCSSGSTGGIGRLLPHERALVELSQDFHRLVGRFEERGDFKRGAPDFGPYWQFNHELQIMTRIAPFFLPYVKLPVRTQLSSERVGSALSDITAGARIPVLGEHFLAGWPSLTFFSSVQVPSGTTFETNNSAELEELTGLGTTLVSVGTALERSFGVFLWTLAYHLSFEPRLLTKRDFVGGPLHVPSINVAFALHERGTLSGGLAANFGAPAQFDGKQIRESSKRKLSANLAYAWKFHSHLGINFSLGGDLPISHLGKNNNSEIYARLGLRVGIF